MKPVLFTVPWLDMPVYGYGVMLGISFVVGWYMMLGLSKWYGLESEKYYVAMTLAAIFSIVGARFFHVISNPYDGWTLMRIFNFREGGLVAYGGYIMGIGSGALYFIYKKVNLWAYLDAATPALAIGLGFTRLGCFMRGCCYGHKSDSIFGISFPKESLVFEQHSARGWELLGDHSMPVLPTQLFESTAGFVLFGITFFILFTMRKQKLAIASDRNNSEFSSFKLPDGAVFWSFIGLYSTFRFMIEFIRDDSGRGTVSVLSTSQFIGLILVAISLFMLFYYLPKHPFKEPETPKKKAAPYKKSRKSKKTKKSKTGRKK